MSHSPIDQYFQNVAQWNRVSRFTIEPSIGPSSAGEQNVWRTIDTLSRWNFAPVVLRSSSTTTTVPDKSTFNEQEVNEMLRRAEDAAEEATSLKAANNKRGAKKRQVGKGKKKKATEDAEDKQNPPAPTEGGSNWTSVAPSTTVSPPPEVSAPAVDVCLYHSITVNGLATDNDVLTTSSWGYSYLSSLEDQVGSNYILAATRCCGQVVALNKGPLTLALAERNFELLDNMLRNAVSSSKGSANQCLQCSELSTLVPPAPSSVGTETRSVVLNRCAARVDPSPQLPLSHRLAAPPTWASVSRFTLALENITADAAEILEEAQKLKLTEESNVSALVFLLSLCGSGDSTPLWLSMTNKGTIEPIDIAATILHSGWSQTPSASTLSRREAAAVVFGWPLVIAPAASSSTTTRNSTVESEEIEKETNEENLSTEEPVANAAETPSADKEVSAEVWSARCALSESCRCRWCGSSFVAATPMTENSSSEVVVRVGYTTAHHPRCPWATLCLVPLTSKSPSAESTFNLSLFATEGNNESPVLCSKIVMDPSPLRTLIQATVKTMSNAPLSNSCGAVRLKDCSDLVQSVQTALLESPLFEQQRQAMMKSIAPTPSPQQQEKAFQWNEEFAEPLGDPILEVYNRIVAGSIGQGAKTTPGTTTPLDKHRALLALCRSSTDLSQQHETPPSNTFLKTIRDQYTVGNLLGAGKRSPKSLVDEVILPLATSVPLEERVWQLLTDVRKRQRESNSAVDNDAERQKRAFDWGKFDASVQAEVEKASRPPPPPPPVPQPQRVVPSPAPARPHVPAAKTVSQPVLSGSNKTVPQQSTPWKPMMPAPVMNAFATPSVTVGNSPIARGQSPAGATSSQALFGTPSVLADPSLLAAPPVLPPAKDGLLNTPSVLSTQGVLPSHIRPVAPQSTLPPFGGNQTTVKVAPNPFAATKSVAPSPFGGSKNVPSVTIGQPPASLWAAVAVPPASTAAAPVIGGGGHMLSKKRLFGATPTVAVDNKASSGGGLLGTPSASVPPPPPPPQKAVPVQSRAKLPPAAPAPPPPAPQQGKQQAAAPPAAAARGKQRMQQQNPPQQQQQQASPVQRPQNNNNNRNNNQQQQHQGGRGNQNNNNNQRGGRGGGQRGRRY